MKTMKTRYLTLLAALILAAAGCKDDDPSGPMSVETVAVTSVSYTSAACSGEATGGGIADKGICWGTSPDPTLLDNRVSRGKGPGTFSVEVDGLQENQAYYFRAYAVGADGQPVYGVLKSCLTYSNGSAGVMVAEIPELKAETATVTCNVLYSGGHSLGERGLCYGTASGPTVGGMKIAAGSGIGQYTVYLGDLDEQTVYYLRPYVMADGTPTYGPECTMTTTEASDPLLMLATDRITLSDATFSATGIATSKRLIADRGICWSTDENPTIADSRYSMGSGNGTSAYTIPGLQKRQTYYVAAYAVTAYSTVYSEVTSFTLLNASPVVQTGYTASNSILRYSAVITGSKITSLGPADLAVTEAGICFSRDNTEPTIADSKVTQANLAVGDMADVKIGRLKPGTKHYVRAYAINSDGVGYGDVIEVETQKEMLMIGTSGSAPASPNYNGLQIFYFNGTVTVSSATETHTRTTNLGEWQLAQYDALNTALGNSSRKLDRHYPVVISNSAAVTNPPLAIGQAKYLYMRVMYLNSSLVQYTAGYYLKYAVDEDGLYTFSDPSAAASNYLTIRNSHASVKQWFDDYDAYLTGHSFMLELESASSAADVLLIPVDDPDKYYKFNSGRVSASFVAPW